MAAFKTLSTLVLFAVIASAFANSIIDEDALEKELQESDFKELHINFDDSSEEVTARTGEKKKQRCGCQSHISCGCCLKPRILTHKFRGCANMTVFPAEKQIQIAVTFEDTQIAQYNFSIARADRICDRLPGKANFLKFCLYTNNTESAEEGFQSCSSLDIIVKNTTAAVFNFSCIRFKDGKISFDNHQDVDREGMLSVKFKNPIKVVIGLFKKQKD